MDISDHIRRLNLHFLLNFKLFIASLLRIDLGMVIIHNLAQP